MLAFKRQDGSSEPIYKLARLAHRLKTASAFAGSPLPALWFLTDEARAGDPIVAARALPPGTGMVLRHYGAPNRAELAVALAAIAHERGLFLLVGADPSLARAVRAHGVHLPRRELAHQVRPSIGGWRTLSAHSRRELEDALRWRPDAVFLSPVFATESHPSAAALGPSRFAALARDCPVPVIGLGGLAAPTAPRLLGSGAMGIAAVGAFLQTTDGALKT